MAIRFGRGGLQSSAPSRIGSTVVGGGRTGGSGGGGSSGGLPPGVSMSTREGYVLETGETVPISDFSRQAIISGARTAAEVQAYVQAQEAQIQKQRQLEEEKRRATEIERQMNEEINRAREEYNRNLRSLTSQQDRLTALSSFSQKVYEARVKAGQERVSSGIAKTANVSGSTITKGGTKTLVEKQIEKVRSGEITSFRLDDGTTITKKDLVELPGVSQQSSSQAISGKEVIDRLKQAGNDYAATQFSYLPRKLSLGQKVGILAGGVGEAAIVVTKPVVRGGKEMWGIFEPTKQVKATAKFLGKGAEELAEIFGVPTITQKTEEVYAPIRQTISDRPNAGQVLLKPAGTETIISPRGIGKAVEFGTEQAIYGYALGGVGKFGRAVTGLQKGELFGSTIKVEEKIYSLVPRKATNLVETPFKIEYARSPTGDIIRAESWSTKGWGQTVKEGRSVVVKKEPSAIMKILGKQDEIIEVYPGNQKGYDRALKLLQPELTEAQAREAIKFTRLEVRDIVARGEGKILTDALGKEKILVESEIVEKPRIVAMFEPSAKQGDLYHGTTSKFLPAIKRKGLVPGTLTGNYQGIAKPLPYVSTGTDIQTARGFATRATIKKGGEPVVFRIRDVPKKSIIKSADATGVGEVRLARVPKQYIKEVKPIMSLNKPATITRVKQPAVVVSEKDGITEYLSQPILERRYITPEGREYMKLSQQGKTQQTFEQISRVKLKDKGTFGYPSNIKGVTIEKPAELYSEASISRSINPMGRKKIPSVSDIYVVDTGIKPLEITYDSPFTYREIPTKGPSTPVKFTEEQAKAISQTLQNIYGKQSTQQAKERLIAAIPKVESKIIPAKSVSIKVEQSQVVTSPEVTQSAYFGRGLYEQSTGGRLAEEQKLKPAQVSAQLSQVLTKQTDRVTPSFKFNFGNEERLSQPVITTEKIAQEVTQKLIQPQKETQRIVPRSQFTGRPLKIRTKVPIPKIPKPTPEIPIGIKSKAKSLLENIRGYDVFTYKGGKEVQIGKNLPVGKATKLGVETTLSTLRASFKLKPSGYTTGYDIDYKAPSRLFGSSKRDINRLVQRRGTRLSARTEVLEIQRARKNKLRRLRWF